MSIEVNNESGTPVDERALSDVGRWVLDALRIDPLAELSVVLLDSNSMAALHEQWMDLPGPTDVMAFPMDGVEESPDPPESHGPPGSAGEQFAAVLGDVVLCPEVAAEQAHEAGHSTEAELLLLCTHGILHLLGYDHGEPEDEKVMFDLQADLVRGFAKATGRGPVHTPRPGTGGEVRDVRERPGGRR